MNYTSLQGGDLLEVLADDASKWAAAFRQHAEEVKARGEDPLDEGFLITWFANAIERSGDVRRWREGPRPRCMRLSDYQRVRRLISEREALASLWRQLEGVHGNARCATFTAGYFSDGNKQITISPDPIDPERCTRIIGGMASKAVLAVEIEQVDQDLRELGVDVSM